MRRLPLLAGMLLATTCTPALAAPCDGVAALALPPDVRIMKATPIDPAFAFAPPGVKDAKPLATSFCRIEGVIEKEIGFELWLPEKAAWTGRFLTGGVGGQAGNFNYRELARGIVRGFASASTDTGHKASDRHWLLGDPQRAANYAERSNHLLAQRAKQIVTAFYGRPIRTSLFVGCSGGGRQALTEAQRFPEDYDGIMAGAPGPKTPEMSARRMWEMGQHSGSAAIMSDAIWTRIAKGAVAACDGKDGVADGVIDHPTACSFKVADLSCRKVSGEACLTDAQVAVGTRIYAPLHDENGRRIDDGLLPGVRVSPQLLPEPFTPGPPYLAVALFGDGVHRDPDWNPATFRIADDLPAIDRVMNLHADNPDIRPFVQRGGKLLIYQGWADPLVAAQPTIAYHEAVQAKLGKVAKDSVRLFMVPGMEHCVGGDTTDRFGGAGGDGVSTDPNHDMLSALITWVEGAPAPERFEAARLQDGRVTRTRPLCAWPRVAHYNGTGDTDAAARFTCEVPSK